MIAWIQHKEVAVGNAQRRYTQRQEGRVTPCISLRIMLLAIELDGQGCLVAIEIEYEASDGVLPAKLEPESSAPQNPPDDFLGY